MSEAPLGRGHAGQVPEGEGWFVVNVADADAMEDSRFGRGAIFEGADSGFSEFGINVRVLEPGQIASMYHREPHQEAFLVLAGECVAVVDGEERPLRRGDFLHMPAGTPHVIAGAGEGPATILMVGGRGGEFEVNFPVDETAAAHGASVAEETDDRTVAYAESGPPRWGTLGLPW